MSPLLTHFQSLVEIVRSLRGPDGCPWDREQTQASLTQYAIEEAFELVEAIESGDQKKIAEELGDYLFQVILQAQVAEDESKFLLSDVIQQLCEKLVRRHPHVFGGEKISDLNVVWKKWHEQKEREALASIVGRSHPGSGEPAPVGRSHPGSGEPAPVGRSHPGSGEPAPVFSYPKNLPALQAAYKIGVKSKRFQFDWKSPREVLEKVREEMAEMEEALDAWETKAEKASASTQKPHPKIAADLEHEIGDVLFSVAQLARHCGLEPEASLREANRRFEQRFLKVLELSGKSADEFSVLSDAEKESLWDRAKRSLA